MTHTETIAALREMGIEIPDSAIEEAGGADDYNEGEPAFVFPTSLLMSVGLGEFDYDTGVWQASSHQVYSFDTEIFDIEHMYRLFLQGIASIVPGFEPTDVQESIEESDEETAPREGFPPSEGKTTVSFLLNGKRFERVLDFYGDWFNSEAIDWVDEVLKAEGFPGSLHGFFDGMQGLILLYGDEEYGKKLAQLIPQPEF